MAGEDIIGFVVLAIVGVVFGTVLAYASRYKKVPPNMAMVIYGRKQGASEAADTRSSPAARSSSSRSSSRSNGSASTCGRWTSSSRTS